MSKGWGGTAPTTLRAVPPLLELLTVATAMASSLRLGSGAVASPTRSTVLLQQASSLAGDPEGPLRHRVIRTDAVDARERYQLLTSLVVPRPIGWVSTRGAGGVLNVAPFSFFSAVAPSPMLVSLSIGTRGGVAKDSLRNILDQGAFCVNVVTEGHLEAMNRTAANLPPEGDEFAFAGLSVAEAETVDAPYVADCPAVLECELHKHVELGEAGALVLGHVRGVRLDHELPIVEGSAFVDSEGLRPVGRLWGFAYALLGEVRVIPRPGL